MSWAWYSQSKFSALTIVYKQNSNFSKELCYCKFSWQYTRDSRQMEMYLIFRK